MPSTPDRSTAWLAADSWLAPKGWEAEAGAGTAGAWEGRVKAERATRPIAAVSSRAARTICGRRCLRFAFMRPPRGVTGPGGRIPRWLLRSPNTVTRTDTFWDRLYHLVHEIREWDYHRRCARPRLGGLRRRGALAGVDRVDRQRRAACPGRPRRSAPGRGPG